MSDREKRRKKERANESKLEGQINDGSNDKFVETVFPKRNESKNLVNIVIVIWQYAIRLNAKKKKLKVRMVRIVTLI